MNHYSHRVINSVNDHGVSGDWPLFHVPIHSKPARNDNLYLAEKTFLLVLSGRGQILSP